MQDGEIWPGVRWRRGGGDISHHCTVTVRYPFLLLLLPLILGKSQEDYDYDFLGKGLNAGKWEECQEKKDLEKEYKTR